MSSWSLLGLPCCSCFFGARALQNPFHAVVAFVARVLEQLIRRPNVGNRRRPRLDNRRRVHDGELVVEHVRLDYEFTVVDPTTVKRSISFMFSDAPR